MKTPTTNYPEANMNSTFTLCYTNVSNPSVEFSTYAEALAAGRKHGFEFTVWQAGRLLASWTVFGGLKEVR